MKFRIGDTVIIECPESILYYKYDGCVCTVEDMDEYTVKVNGADNGWWPVNNVKHYEPDEEINAEDLFSIM